MRYGKSKKKTDLYCCMSVAIDGILCDCKDCGWTD